MLQSDWSAHVRVRPVVRDTFTKIRPQERCRRNVWRMQVCARHGCMPLQRQGPSRGGISSRHRCRFGYWKGLDCGKVRTKGRSSIMRWCWGKPLGISAMTSGSDARGDPVRESMDLLGWEELCLDVAQFAVTAMGKKRVKRLPVANSKMEAGQLQSETVAGSTLIYELALRIDLGAISSDTVDAALIRAKKGGFLQEDTLLACAKMLKVSRDAKKSIAKAGQSTSSSVLLDKIKPILSVWKAVEIPKDVVQRIEAAIDDTGAIRDSARDDLGAVRSRYRSLKERIQSKLKDFGGAATLRAGRYCVGVPVETKLPRNTIILGMSTKEGLNYVEPQGVVELNNQFAACYGEMKSVEESVLWELTECCAQAEPEMSQILEALTHLDVILAKAQYTSWINGSYPVLMAVPPSSEAELELDRESQKSPGVALVQLHNLRHPLLLGQHLLQEKKKNGEGRNGPKLPVMDSPVPLDFLLRNQTRALVITGPNTGGKTATLKAFGLSVLMAQAGLGVPAEAPAHIPCYSAVLVDVGDEQSLNSNLSTFSGHLTRIQALRDVADGDCLILLDELGTGSNPDEGAALGTALLRLLVQREPGGAFTTVATTHHGLLATLAYEDGASVFENASVEFDDKKMAPTYKLMMGVPGRSNALAIAGTLGMGDDVLRMAQKRVGKGHASERSIIQELENAKRAGAMERDAHLEALRELEGSQREAEKMRGSLTALKRKVSSQEQSMYKQLLSSAAKKLSRIEKSKSRIPDEQAFTTERKEGAAASADGPEMYMDEAIKVTDSPKIWTPTVGDMVFVPKLKQKLKILKVGPGEKLLVGQGFFSVKTTFADVVPG